LDDADASDSPWLLYRGVKNKDVPDIAYCAESQSRLDIAMAAVSRLFRWSMLTTRPD
jgi:hypothetical protein